MFIKTRLPLFYYLNEEKIITKGADYYEEICFGY